MYKGALGFRTLRRFVTSFLNTSHSILKDLQLRFKLFKMLIEAGGIIVLWSIDVPFGITDASMLRCGRIIPAAPVYILG